MTPEKRLGNVMVTDTCWLWMKARDTGGYGVAGVMGERNRIERVHRWSYEFFVGPVPDGLNVLHRCDVRNCLNPDHLFVGTHGMNSVDMATKGRGMASLTPDEVRAIRSSSDRQVDLAARYGVSQACISSVKTGKTYGWVE